MRNLHLFFVPIKGWLKQIWWWREILEYKSDHRKAMLLCEPWVHQFIFLKELLLENDFLTDLTKRHSVTTNFYLCALETADAGNANHWLKVVNKFKITIFLPGRMRGFHSLILPGAFLTTKPGKWRSIGKSQNYNRTDPSSRARLQYK